MAGIVQHKSGVFAAENRGGAVTFDSPVTEGNLIIAVTSAQPDEGNQIVIDSQGNGSFNPGAGGNAYNRAIDTGSSGPSTVELGVYYVIAKASGTLDVVLSLDGGDQSCHLHIYEVAGFSTLDQIGQNFQPATTDATVSTSGATVSSHFVLAVFANASGEIMWTLGGNLGGEESTSEVNTVASGGATVSATGIQTATATASSAGDLTSVIVTFSSFPTTGPGPFLGSVVVSDSDSDPDFPFIGSVTIIAAPPDGNPTAYPFLGRVKLGTAPAGASGKIVLGTVVVVDTAPGDNPNGFPYLGTVESV